ncbi:MAG: shikimate dehydrogenase [Candidatus Eremiobacteraeota bacterium]|nr:shikimate dehydrogenase [Candidatus Eremiobacteraeota bacterium]
MIDRADLETLWLLGDPVSHSLSPLIQNTAIQRMGLKIVYLASRVAADNLEQVVRALPALGAVGANVTVPHKLRAFEICDRLSDRAQTMKAVNTLHFRNGEIFGDNTDGVGWWNSLTGQFSYRFSKAVVIGAGGASRAICHTLATRQIPNLVLLNRTAEKAHQLRDELPAGFEVKIAGLESFEEHLEPNTLVVQTTSVGLKGEFSPVKLPETWPEGCCLSELIYGRKTALMKKVVALGGRAQDGLGMLCGQAAESLSLWTGRPLTEVPVDEMMRAAQQRLL